MWKAQTAINIARRLSSINSISSNATLCSLVKSTDSSLRTATSPPKNDFPGSRTQSDDELELSVGFAVGKTVSRRDKLNFILQTLQNLKDDKEAVYGALDAWVAWEENFPIAQLRKALRILEEDQQWHKIVQVIKWMLSKGQGTTNGTYEQLLKALDRDHRAEEAHEIWQTKVGCDLHSVPWSLCNLMISIYYRNNMPQRILKLFKSLEDFERKPNDKSIVQRVVDACEIMNMGDEKERILMKYNYLLKEPEGKGKWGSYRGKQGTRNVKN